MPSTVQHAGRPEGASPGAACGVGAGVGVKAGVTAATGAWTVTGTEIVTGSLCSSVGIPGYSVRSTRNSCVIHSSPSWRVLTNAELLAQHLAPLGERGPRIGSRLLQPLAPLLSSRRRGSTSLMSRPVVLVRWQRRTTRRGRPECHMAPAKNWRFFERFHSFGTSVRLALISQLAGSPRFG